MALGDGLEANKDFEDSDDEDWESEDEDAMCDYEIYSKPLRPTLGP